MIRQQRKLFDIGYAQPNVQPQFHDSIGATTLLMDYRKTIDRFYINALGNTPNKWNPSGVADGGTYPSGPPNFTVQDLDYILEWLVINRCPPFADGLYHALVHPRFFSHLRRDDRFLKQLLTAAYYPVGYLMAVQDDPFKAGFMPPANPYMTSHNPTNHPGLIGTYPYLGQVLPGCDDQMMPGGFVYNQFRFFVSNNIPTKQVQLNYTAVVANSNEATGLQFRTAYPAMFFGRHAVGEIFGGDPETGLPVEMRAHENSDYRRFLIVTWHSMMGLARLNDDFVIEARTYGL
jgi:hypothetical protein